VRDDPGATSWLPRAASPLDARWAPDIPATGAWRPGDPVGRRQFVPIGDDRPFAMEFGGFLSDACLAYETWGELAADGGNAVLVCHALTGDSHAAGDMAAGHPTPGWWDDMIGPGRPLDTERLFVVCANVLGGCQGSTGPASPDPVTGKPYGSRFPMVSIRDIVRAQARLADHLGIGRWLCVVGGSMGGMQVLEWAVMYPQRVRAFAAIATTVAASAWQLAWSAAGRTALALDPRWRGGDYYDAPAGDGPHAGLAVARSIAQVTYRSDEVFAERFGRELVDPIDGFGPWSRFQVEGYLDHHGQKLARRFDANSYLVLNRAMDLHDLGRGRGSVELALRRIVASGLVLSITSDALYHPYQQRQLHDGLIAAGKDSAFGVIESPHGHDGFLLEFEQVADHLVPFLTRIEKDA
jgi:homoserine O-acetyltransferase/O-succinyltransferase